MELVASKKFSGDLKDLISRNSLYSAKVEKKLLILLQNPKYPSLRLHKLSGSNNYSLSIDLSIRIILHFEGDKIFLLKIGKHEEVY